MFDLSTFFKNLFTKANFELIFWPKGKGQDLNDSCFPYTLNPNFMSPIHSWGNSSKNLNSILAQCECVSCDPSICKIWRFSKVLIAESLFDRREILSFLQMASILEEMESNFERKVSTGNISKYSDLLHRRQPRSMPNLCQVQR